MQLSQDVCRKFGQFAYQDEQKGIEAITAIQDFMDEYQDISISGDDSQAKIINIEREQDGTIKVVKSVKLLPNLVLNIKDIVTNKEKLFDDSIDVVTIIGGFSSDNWIFNIGAGLRLIKFAINLATFELKEEHAKVLVALYYLCRNGELNLEISVEDLQNKVQHNFNLNIDELDDLLEDLVDLHCVSRQRNVIY